MNIRESSIRVIISSVAFFLVSTTGAANASAGFAQTSSTPAATTQKTPPVFDFHSGFWTSLHMFLCQEAMIRNQMMESKKALTKQGRDVKFLEYPGQDKLNADQKKVWESALDFYSAKMTEVSGLNHGALEMAPHLARLTDSQAAGGPGISAEAGRILNEAAPIYRDIWWQDHSRASKKWVASVSGLLVRIGVELSNKLAGDCQSHWPPHGIRVETVPYVGAEGVWASPAAQFVMASTLDSKNQKLYAAEVLLIGAARILDTPLQTKVAAAFKEARKPVPHGLMEALRYYTTGEVLRACLAEKNLLQDYTPYAAHLGLYARNPGWGGYLALLKRYWQPYLDGKSDLDRAMKEMAQDS